MGDPPAYDPEQRPKPDAPRPEIERADWLVGPEDGITAELERKKSEAQAPLERPMLARPKDPESGRVSQSSRMASPFLGGAPPPVVTQQNLPSWDKGRSSVPKLRRAGDERAPLAEPSRDFPMDDAEERARIGARLAEEQAREAAFAARPHEVVKPEEFDLPSVPVPWWAQVPHLLTHDRRVQLVLLVVVLSLTAIALWPRAEKTISVAHLKQQSDRYADQEVRVGGKVGEVFAVGGSWAYTLIQGRDTIVVFSRTRRPSPRERIIVVGTLSSGSLDGQTRAAIFEATR